MSDRARDYWPWPCDVCGGKVARYPERPLRPEDDLCFECRNNRRFRELLWTCAFVAMLYLVAWWHQ